MINFSFRIDYRDDLILTSIVTNLRVDWVDGIRKEDIVD